MTTAGGSAAFGRATVSEIDVAMRADVGGKLACLLAARRRTSGVWAGPLRFLNPTARQVA